MNAEVEGLRDQEKTTLEFLNALRSSYAIQSDVGIKFTLEKQIAQKETELAKIRKKIKQAYGLDVFEASTVLNEKIRSLDIDTDVAEIHLVNCNREAVRDKFWNAF